MISRSNNTLKGLTVTELLVTLTLVAILATLLLPAIYHLRMAAIEVNCRQNLKDLGIAFGNHYDASGKFPESVIKLNTLPPSFVLGSEYLALLPYLEQVQVYDAINFSTAVTDTSDYDKRNETIGKIRLNCFLCPLITGKTRYSSAEKAAAFSYPLCAGKTKNSSDGYHYSNSFGSITDGTSKTILFGEWIPSVSNTRPEELVLIVFGTPKTIEQYKSICSSATTQYADDLIGLSWYSSGFYDHLMPPGTNSCYIDTFVDLDLYQNRVAISRHPEHINACFYDGSVRPISYSIDYGIWQGLATIAGGETISGEY